MFAVKLLANSVVARNYYIALNIFEHVFTFDISHITLILYYNWSFLKAFKVLTSYIKLCYVYVQFKWVNQSCSPSKINQSISVE